MKIKARPINKEKPTLLVKKNKTLEEFRISNKSLMLFLDSKNHPFPELKEFLKNPKIFSKNEHTVYLLKEIKKKFKNLEEIPKLSKDLYEQYEKDGKKETYETPYNKRRENLSICVFYYMLGNKKYLNLIEKYLNFICDEHTWVMPFHEGRIIDLYSADTAFTLAEILFILKDKLNQKIYEKVSDTINQRVFIPYLDENVHHEWYKKDDNWNAVCNSEIGSAFLLIENNCSRKVHAIKKALESLKVYIKESFKEDGSTEEGILYWNYGMSMFVIFSELLRASSKNKIDLLKSDKIKKIAQYPLNIQIGLDLFATFSDCSETGTIFNPGIIQRLSERTNEKSLLGLNSPSSKLDWFGIPTLLRYILWWNGKIIHNVKVNDSILSNAGIVKLTNSQSKFIVVAKAGDNGENHNHNDVGSFIINISGENFITDPGAGLYCKGYHDYDNGERYKNIFTNSYGHNVPKIDGKLQSAGKEFSGRIFSVKTKDNIKSVSLEMSRAYDIPNLKNLNRKISLDNDKAILIDEYIFSENSLMIEEAFITWQEVIIKDNKAIISCKNHKLLLTIKEPENSKFYLERLEKESRENNKSRILKRISFVIPPNKNNKVNVKIEMKPIIKMKFPKNKLLYKGR